MQDSLAVYIRDLLVEKLSAYNPTLDVSEGSTIWTKVVVPVFDALGTDPYSTDIRSFLKDKLTQVFPSLAVEDGDQITDMLVTPLEVLLEPFKLEHEIIRRGLSLNSTTKRLEDVKDLAANYFVTPRDGSKVIGSVRVYFTVPTYVTITSSTEFSTISGLKFYPVSLQAFRPEVIMMNRSGQYYYVDIPVESEGVGSQYRIAAGSVTGVKGIAGAARVTNLSAFDVGGDDPDTADQLISRVRTALTERSLSTKRGIIQRLKSEFTAISDVDVVGFGDPEMNRDVITGAGEGSVLASGVSIVVGQFVLMFSLFENHGANGRVSIAEGNEVELNFWHFLYEETVNEKFTIEQILFDSRDAIPQMPSILLFQINATPSVAIPVAGTLPGVLPGVFCVVRGTGKIEIADIPGGILRPNTARGTIEVADNEIHIGGHADVWLRDSNIQEDLTLLSDIRSEGALLEGSDLVISGNHATLPHLLTRTYTVSSTTALAVGSTIVGASGAEGTIYSAATDGATHTYRLCETNGIAFVLGETVSPDGGITNAVLTDVSYFDWEDAGVRRDMVVEIPTGTEEGAYRILRVDGPFLYVAVALTTTTSDVYFRIIDEITVTLFDAKNVLLPFGDETGEDLRTTIGTALVRTATNLQSLGIAEGDSLEILEGDNKGIYEILRWDAVYGGTGPILSTAMSSSESGLSFRVFRPNGVIQRPLLRIMPDGVSLVDASQADTGFKIPYALPVDVRSLAAFSGAMQVSEGVNGFVLMDPGESWAPTADKVIDIETYDWSGWTGDDFQSFYADEKFKRFYTDGALEYDGYLAVISVHGAADGQMYLDSNLPAFAQTFLQSMKTWLLAVIATFGFSGDETELVNAFSPIILGPKPVGPADLLFQFEIVIPYEIFDGHNNTFMALPEFNWEQVFENTSTFESAIGAFNTGAIEADDPALCSAVPGDTLTITSGSNAGSYVIDKVTTYYLINEGALSGGEVVLEDAYKVCLVTIKGEFPVVPLQGLPEYFAGGTATWSLPAVPSLPFTVTDSLGNPVSGWDWVEITFTWLFQLLTSMGFDLPEDIALDVPATMELLWKMLFSSYSVGHKTAEQTLRMFFQEPTACCVFAPTSANRVEWTPSGGTPQVDTHAPQQPTRFAYASGSEPLWFVPSDNVSRQLYPAADIEIGEFPRDAVVGTPYGGQNAVYFTFTGSDDSLIALGVRPGDYMEIAEPRWPLVAASTAKDRVVAVTTVFGSPVIALPAITSGTFTAAQGGDVDDTVRVGDIVFIEEGDDEGAYTVTAVTARTLTLDTAMTASTERVWRTGNDAALTATSVIIGSATAAFVAADIGRYITIWGSSFTLTDGSFEITAVAPDGSTCTVDADPFPSNEAAVHWAITDAPLSTPGSSSIGGATELIGVRPIRIYRGTRTSLCVVATSNELTRSANALVTALDEGRVPRTGINMPYWFVRRGEHFISAFDMAQNKYKGLFYFDVPAMSLSHGTAANIPKDVKLEPVIGTFDSFGYHIDVDDPRFTFSTQEDSFFVLSPIFIPALLNETPANWLTLASSSMQVSYEYSAVTAQVQSLLLSETERNICANMLARHFLPAYVSVDVFYKGGNSPTALADSLVSYINNLPAMDELDVSKIEKIVNSANVESYTHPFSIYTLTHDLDRRIVCTQSESVISDDNIAYNGTNRTTFFIAGFNAAGYNDTDLPSGPRIRPVQVVTSPALGS